MSVLFQLKEYFRIQTNLFNSLKPKILYLQKKKKKKNPKTRASRMSLMQGDLKNQKRRARKKGVRKCAKCWEACPICRGWNA